MGAGANLLTPEWEPWLRRLGLNPEALGATHILHGLQERMAARRVVDLPAYAHLLQNDPDEVQELTARLVVPESWFFRDVQPFRCLQAYVRDHWRQGQPSAPLRVLSVPCSTGEEPYSIAMTLLGLGLDQFQVEGVDLSRAALGKAAAATYTRLSFRESDEEFAQLTRRYTEPGGARTVVHAEVRSVVRFRQGNLLDPEFLAGEAPYQVIFCRNLFIYLEASARRRALVNLHRLVVPDGLLYVGHVEAAAVARDLFRPFHPAFPFAFQPATASDWARDAVPSGQLEHVRVQRNNARTTPQSTIPKSAEVPQTQAQPECGPVLRQPAQSSLTEARQAADRGQLKQAAALCGELLRTDPTNAAAHCLLGVIRQAQGEDTAAEQCFQRALYLEPRLHEALVHLALLAERRGQDQRAVHYRRRAGRAAEGESQA